LIAFFGQTTEVSEKILNASHNHINADSTNKKAVDAHQYFHIFVKSDL
jgi:hypothetical protein